MTRSTLGLAGGVALAMVALISLKSGPEVMQEFTAEHKLDFDVSNDYCDKYGKPGLQCVCLPLLLATEMRCKNGNNLPTCDRFLLLTGIHG